MIGRNEEIAHATNQFVDHVRRGTKRMRTDQERARKENQSTEKLSTEHSWKKWSEMMKRDEKSTEEA
jgi:hypothetical protein